ncbi:MAG: biotin/lipoyl-containing protein [Candidatus Aminicenantaceae bacterium]
MNLSFWLNNREYRLTVKEKKKNDILVGLNGNTYEVAVEFLNSDEILLIIDGKIYNAIICSNNSAFRVCVNGLSFDIYKKSVSQILGGKHSQRQKRDVKTSMAGKIVKVLMTEGENVEEGQAVLILEAMKMQNEIKSPQKGKVTKIVRSAGDSVETGALLFSVE